MSISMGGVKVRYTGGGGGASSAVFEGLQAPPSVSSLTWFNQDNATASDGTGVINVSVPSGQSSNNRRVLATSVPAGPWTMNIGFTWNPSSTPYPVFGMCVYDQGTGYLIEWDLYWTGQEFHTQWSRILYNGSQGTAYGDSAVSNRMSAITTFLRYVDDGTNLSVYWSNDNVNWTQFGSARSRTEYLASGPTHVGLCMDAVPNVGANLTARVFHWKLH